jgi:hypothetical protein
MRKRIYFGTVDRWISERLAENSWTSVILDVVGLSLAYPFMYYLPQIALYVNGYIISPKHHYDWTMKWFGFLCSAYAFLIVLKVIRLLLSRSKF